MTAQQQVYISRLIGIQTHLYPNFTGKIEIQYIKKVLHYIITVSSEKYKTETFKLDIRDDASNHENMDAIETFRLNLKLKKVLRHDERRKTDVSKGASSNRVPKDKKVSGTITSK